MQQSKVGRTQNEGEIVHAVVHQFGTDINENECGS